MFVKAVFDRTKTLEKQGYGRVDLLVMLSQGNKKYILLRKCTAIEWRQYSKSVELKKEIEMYNSICLSMFNLHEEMTVANFNKHIGFESNRKEETKKKEQILSPTGFIDYMAAAVKKEKLKPATITRKNVTMEAMRAFGRLSKFSDITLNNIRAWDEWLRTEDIRTDKEKQVKGSKPKYRSDVTVNNYHKILKRYTHYAFLDHFINDDPYEKFTYPKGKYKERRPLTEEELVRVRDLDLPEKEARVRDLFIFCAYTGLAYIDSQMFDFKTMTEKHDGVFYIDGNRIKTGTYFYSPILPPALEVLKRYNYQLPRISNQKANDYLHLIQSRLGITKPMTTHVARHSFATLVLSHDVPVEKLARMMGHKNIHTTQTYAKILKSTIEKHTNTLITSLM